MSLATRCSACGTMFRVVRDQLRVSDGWVRCGRCDTVFNAHDALVDLEAEAATAQASSPATKAPPFADTAQGEAFDIAPARARSAAPTRSAAGAVPQESAAPEPTFKPLPEVAWHEATEPAFDPQLTTAWPAARTAPGLQPAAAGQAPAAAGGAPAGRPPSFVRRAERDARWTTPAMRSALLGAALMLLALLGVQAAYHFRDTLAASSPTAARWLRGACARWGCRIDVPRRIRDVTLEGSALARIAQQPRAVKLSINLRNRSSTDLALPWVDLSLTDAEGQLIVRRALSPADFRIDPPLIPRGAELPLELVLSAGDRTINGYTVELFHP